jgi:hypothetical protein
MTIFSIILIIGSFHLLASIADLLDSEEDFQKREKDKLKYKEKEEEKKESPAADFVFTRNNLGNLGYIFDRNDPSGAILYELLANRSTTATVINGFSAIRLRNSSPWTRVGSEYIIKTQATSAVLAEVESRGVVVLSRGTVIEKKRNGRKTALSVKEIDT